MLRLVSIFEGRTIRTYRPRVRVRSESRAARQNVARVQAHRKRAAKPGKPGRAVGAFEFTGRWLTLLIAHGYLAEDHPPDGRAFDRTVRDATTKMVGDLEAGKLMLTR